MKKVLINVGPSAPVYGAGYVSGIGKSIIWLMNAISKLPQEKIPFEIIMYASGLKSVNFDYYNLDEKIDLNTNISSLLSEVSLEYVGSVDTALDEDLVKARRNTIFIEEFSIRKSDVKKLKK